MMATRALLSLAMLTLAMGTAAAQDPGTSVGLQHDVVFTAYPAYARNGELLRRLQSPLTALREKEGLQGNLSLLRAQPLDPAKQHFALYVPPGPPPPDGDSLLVFVPPWDRARVPLEWIPILDRSHTIFVTAADSGNNADVFNRREPLALLAAYAVQQRYHVDPAHVYIGGFSGGSRVALRLALGYPDVFRGALLDAGSDPIGTAQEALPPVDLLHQFQQSSRIVFLTGENDEIRQAQLAHASASLRQWCVSDTAYIMLLDTGHALADAAGFAQAIDALAKPSVPDATTLARCRDANQATLAAALEHVQGMLGAGDLAGASRALEKVDARFGGLAAPRSVDLLRMIDARRTQHH